MWSETTPKQSLACDAAEARLLLAAAGSGEAVVLRRRMEPQPRLGRYGATHPTHPNGIIGPSPRCLGGGDYHVWDGPHCVAPLTKEAEYVAVRQCPWYSAETDDFDVLDVLEPFATSAPMRFYRVVGIGENATETTTFAEARHTFTARQADGWDGPPPRGCGAEWMPAEQMPRELSRLTLRVVSISLARADAGAWCWEVVVKSEMKGLER